MYHACLLLARCHLCGFAKNQTCVVPWLICVLLYDWPLVLTSYPIYMRPYDWFVTCSLFKSTHYSFIGPCVSFYLVCVLTIVLVHVSVDISFCYLHNLRIQIRVISKINPKNEAHNFSKTILTIWLTNWID